MSQSYTHEAPLLFARNITASTTRGRRVLARVNIPEALLRVWGIEIGDQLDFHHYEEYDAEDTPLPYAIFHPAVGAKAKYKQGRYKISSQGQVTIPEELLVSSGYQNARIAQCSGRLAVISASTDMAERARLVMQEAAGPVGPYPYGRKTTGVPLEIVTRGISEVPAHNHEGQYVTSLAAPIFEAMFPQVAPLRERIAAVERGDTQGL